MTIVTLDAVRKRSFTYPVTYKASDVTVDLGDTRVTRAGNTRVTRGGNTRISHNISTLGKKQVLQANKRSFTKSVVVIE